ncbi:hypothetical protein ACIGEP_16640 [Microbacterium sp. NPDC077663]|uniref:hypothetical protein n=1 Tax=Microbacterium sp. NPDC077663 TaxID=3364189 RepID=UPI0037CB3577
MIQITVLMPLVIAVTIFSALEWWIPAGIAIVGAVLAVFWIRRAVENRKIDEILAANAGADDPQPHGTGDEPRDSKPEPDSRADREGS